jgi:acyl-CoA reductase-like NAD-dependent aldehyde dehydrogenase
MSNTILAPEVFQMHIGGEWVAAESNEMFDSINPYTNSPWASVPEATPSDVDRAVKSAREAFESGSWASSTAAGRAALLRKFGDLILENVDELTRVQVMENGKLIREVHGQTRALANHCYFFAGAAENITGQTLPSSVPNFQIYTVREPIGVIAAITPWNSPLALLLWKLCPALAAGNTVVIKPSEITPVSTLVLMRLLEKAGLPAGVVSVVTGHGAVGAALAQHPLVDKIAFTGSTEVGRMIAESAGRQLKRVSLELGGKSPNILFADADIDNAINGIVAGIFAASGQTCMAGSRVLVQETVYDEVVQKLADKANQVRLGDPLNQQTEMGTVACKAQFDKVLAYVDIAKEEGARLVAGGFHPEDPGLDQGLFVRPTVFADVDNSMRIAREEVFGPVAAVIPFKDEEDAVRIANDTNFGLAAGIWTTDITRGIRMTRSLRAGTVWINNYRKTNYIAPFGGFGDSGLGRENGPEAIYEYTETKTVWIDLGNKITDPFNPRA